MKRTFASRTFASRTFANKTWAGEGMEVVVGDEGEISRAWHFPLISRAFNHPLISRTNPIP